jgi:flagellar biogenesis protein FliO
MTRLLKLLLALGVVLVAIFMLSKVDSERPIKRVEVPVNPDETAQ